MKLLRLLALSIAATAWCAAAAFACGDAKSAANTSACGMKSASAKTASATSCGSKSAGTVTASAASCGAKSAGTKTASAMSCGSKSATAVTAAAAGSGNCAMSAEACKTMMASGACTAEMQAACSAKGAKAAATVGCSMHSMAAHADCAVCSDEMACDDDVRATGARAQVVPLRNGTMIVYTLDDPQNVRGLQAAVARHNERVIAALQSGAKLCSSCKKLRGALASGKLVREVVNVERGCQLLITSSDRSIVQQVHTSSSAQVAARTRS